jgi:glycosyltransferase involved in cell wall biosynthesis
MRILFLASDFPSPLQPARGTFNLALAKALARKHELRVIAPIAWPIRWKSKSGPAKSPDFPVWRPTYYYPPKFQRARYHLWMNWSIRKAVAQATENWRPDAVLAYWAHPDGAAGATIAEQLGVPSAIIVGGSDVLLLPKDPARKPAVVQALRTTTAVVTVCQQLKSAVVDLGIDPEKIHVWTQGVDAKIFHPGEKSAARARLGIVAPETVFLCVARLEHVKGVDLLLDACYHLLNRGDKFRLYIVGGGSEAAKLEKKTWNRGLTRNVYFLGPRGGRELADWYRAADRTVLSSRSEGLPNVLRESLACGTRFIATEVGGVREIAGPGDFLCPPNDPVALAELMHYCLTAAPAAPPPPLPDWDQSADAIAQILSFGNPSPLPGVPVKSA